MNEMATQKTDVMQPVDMAVITEYLDSTGLTKSLLPKEKTMFIEIAKAYGLNPFKREIYCTAYGEGQNRQCSIVTGYEVYLKRAERIGKLDGWEANVDGKVSDGTLSATVTIHRKDWSHPFHHKVYYREVVQKRKDGTPNRFWASQPSFMTRKVAIAQAFRLCFPDEFGGMPYTNDEMGVEKEAPYVEEKTVEVKPSEKPVEKKNVIAPNKPSKEPTEAYLVLEKLIDDNRMELKGQPYKLAVECLNNPASTDDDYIAMTERCNKFLAAYRAKYGQVSGSNTVQNVQE